MHHSCENSPFLKIAYITITDSSAKTFLDYDIFLVLDGSIRILKDKQTIFLGKDDVFLFEPGYTYQVSSAGNNIVLSIIIDNRFFLKGRSLQTGYYVCSSAEDSARNYNPLRQLLGQTASIYFSGTDICDLQLLSYAYNLLYYLNAYHYETAKQLPYSFSPKYKERMTEILSYLHKNYASPITLQETAESLHLSGPYLSAFFKQNMKENFNSYVNHLRLEHAVEELIYTDKSITSISYDNGFASMNAFNKLFREAYQTTPSRYRREKQKERQLQASEITHAVKELPMEEHMDLLLKYGEPSTEILKKIRFPTQENIHIKDMHHSVPVAPIWKKLLNLGPITQLFTRDMDKQMNQVQEGVGFQYGRLEHVADYKLFQANFEQDTIVFSSFDRAVDTLQMHGMLPYLDLSLPPEAYEEYKAGEICLDIEEYIFFLKHLVRHNANMYGPDYMETWYFEINYYENPFLGKHENPESFAERFSRSYAYIKKYMPYAKVGGLCHDVIGDYSLFHKILECLKKRDILPDFLNLGVFPFELTQDDEQPDPLKRLYYTRDTSYALHKLREFKQEASLHFEVLPEFHIAYLSPDYYSTHFLSDTCFQSTFFFHNTVDLIGEAEMLGYHRLSDNTEVTDETNDFLEGKNGLFNRFGIKKTGEHLLEIFSKCRNNLVSKGSDYVVLKGSLDRYMIGLCNYTYMSDYDCFALNKKIPITDAYKIYESPQTKNIDLKLGNLSEGEYDIIVYQINKKHGSPLDEWARNGYWDRFSRDELEYMRKILQPLRTHYVKTSTDGTMEFHMQLLPHEVVFIVLLQRW